MDEIGRGKTCGPADIFQGLWLGRPARGYAMAKSEIIAILNRVKPPFNVTRIGQRAALASLENEDYKNQSVRLNRKNKAKLFARLQAWGCG